ncbi:MAG: GTP cyclohydrolase I FolE [Hydrogenophaga sp.]|uniref:GTP cyclohydrolase I FolE n=1 Tax=Hydrogenophaga sp. TaxID=1904254 RepID=UPI002ABB1333|nr:GTP cyclohydrolase I FolE [Hydrogenophaga sp.]MDZ4281868.1 GTP cyclohydrolase I FolE [Hydrogenophaga sp.]
MSTLDTWEQRPELADVEAAVRTLIRWAGEDPEREGLRATPERVARAYQAFFAGYQENPAELLATTFEEGGDFEDIVLVRDIRFESHCEHHLVPIVGVAHVAYLPAKRVVGLSKIARVVDAFARRMQIQERLTSQIAETIHQVLQPRGVAVVIEAQHMCMTTRGVYKPGSTTVTQRWIGRLRTDANLRNDFWQGVGSRSRDGT